MNTNDVTQIVAALPQQVSWHGLTMTHAMLMTVAGWLTHANWDKILAAARVTLYWWDDIGGLIGLIKLIFVGHILTPKANPEPPKV
jgi:hypothetical protein